VGVQGTLGAVHPNAVGTERNEDGIGLGLTSTSRVSPAAPDSASPRLKARRFNPRHRCRLVIVRRITGRPNRPDDRLLRVNDQDATGYGNQGAAERGRDGGDEEGPLFSASHDRA